MVKNGIEIPKEYTNNSNPPFKAFELAAIVKIEPNIGLLHGIQTSPTAPPKRIPVKKPPPLNFQTFTLFSFTICFPDI